MSNYHICFVTNSMTAGGAERCISHLSNQFTKQGQRVSIVLSEPLLEIAYPLDSEVELIKMSGISFKKNPKSVLQYLKSLRCFIKSSNPSALICFFPEFAVYCWIASIGIRGIPIIFSERNDPKNNLSRWSLKIFQRLALLISQYIVFQTSGAQDYYGRLVKRKSTIILNPFDANTLPCSFSGKRDNRIVSIGRLTPQKNQLLLIDVFSKIVRDYNHYSLVIYGEGELRPVLEEQIKKYGLEEHVFLPGNSKTVLSEINSARLFILTSDYEGLPNALIEAMALGLPCISTDCSPGGARELIINNINGMVVPCRDEVKLESAIRYMLDNDEKSLAMGERAKSIIERMNVSVISNQWLKIIQKVSK